MVLVQVLLDRGPVVVGRHADGAEEADPPALVHKIPVPNDGALRGHAQSARLAVEERLGAML